MNIRPDLELKVGIFVLVGVFILTVIILSIGDIDLLEKGYTIRLRFNDVGGLKIGAPVNLLGVEVGEVRSIDFIYNKNLNKKQVELVLWIKEGIEIGDDTRAKIKRLGLMGPKYVDLSPGNPEARSLEENDILYGQDAITIEDVTEEIYLASDEIKRAVFYMNDVLADKKIRDDFRRTISNTKELTEKLDRVIDRIEKAEGTIGLLISEDKVYRDLEDFVADIKEHPWKLLIRTKERREKERSEEKEDKEKKGFIIQRGSQ